MKLPKISINIPVRFTEETKIVQQSLRHIDYPKNLLEVIIVGGNHIAKQRNIAVKKSKGEIIYLLDNDSRIQKNALKILAKEFNNPNVAAVGGPSLTPTIETNYVSWLIGKILQTHFGALRMRYRYSTQKKPKKTSEFELIGANVALRKSVLLKVGGFDETIVPNEETELLRRLTQKGYSLIYNPKLVVFRSNRKTLFALCKQFYYYGQGRTKQLLKNSVVTDIIFLVPILFLFYVFSLIFIHKPIYYIPIALYVLLGLATATKAAIKYKRVDLLFTMLFVFPLVHGSYAIGLLSEFLHKSETIHEK